MLNNNHYLVPSFCSEYLINQDNLIEASSFIGTDGDYFEVQSIGVDYMVVQLIDPSEAPHYLFKALKNLEEDILPNRGADDDVYDYIPDFIDQIIFLSIQISEEQLQETCKNLNRIFEQDDPQSDEGLTYLESFNENEDDIIEEDYTALNTEKYRAAIQELRSLLQ